MNKAKIYKILFWLTVIIAAIIIFRLVSCNKTVTPTIPAKVFVKQVDTIYRDRAGNIDSFNKVTAKLNADLKAKDMKYDDLTADYLNAEKDAQNTVSQAVPDTCLQYQRQMQAKIAAQNRASAAKDKACNDKNAALGRLNNTLNEAVKDRDKQFASLQVKMTDCIATVKTLEKQKPRGFLYAGAQAGYLPGKISFGPVIGWQFKSGTSFEIGGMLTGGLVQYTGGIRKPIRLRKK